MKCGLQLLYYELRLVHVSACLQISTLVSLHCVDVGGWVAGWVGATHNFVR